MSTRMPRDEWLMRIAQTSAIRSTCPRAHVGAVLAKETAVISVTFNGAPSGVGHCEDVGCIVVGNHCMTATHAEANAIAFCASEGINTRDTTLIVTHSPCPACAKLIERAGIIKVIYGQYTNRRYP